jgi:uncharacterized protein YegP (UPF0339 family)
MNPMSRFKGMKTRFEFFQGKDGKWYWRAKAPNGRIIADGAEGYDSDHNVWRAVDDFLTDVVGERPTVDEMDEILTKVEG